MLVRGRQKKIVAVDWDARVLRVVHALMGKRGVRIDRLLSAAIPPHLETDNPRKMGHHIRRTLDHEGIGTRHAVVDIPRDQAILKTLTLPTTQPEQLPGMVRIQIAKELPFPVTDAVIDYAVAPVQEGQVTGDVLVAAIRRETLEFYEAAFAAAGLKLDRMGLRPYAVKVAAGELLKHAMPERVLFIDVRPTFMEIDVLRHGALVFSRSASVTIVGEPGESSPWPTTGAGSLSISGASAGSEATGADRLQDPRVIETLVLEVTRSIEAYRAGDAGATIDYVVIGGDVGVEESLAEAIEKRLEITTELYNPASTFGWEPDEGAAASAFAASLGLVLGHADDGALHFDFLHPKKEVSVAKRRLRKAPIAAAVVLLFVLAGGVGVALTRDDRAVLATLEKKISALQDKRRDNRKFLDLVNDIAAFDEGQQVWVDVLYEVFALLPSNQEIVVENLDMNQRDGRITLKTRTKNRETAIGLIRKLEDYRREDGGKQCFRVTMGPQAEKPGEKYPYEQNLRVAILKEADDRKASGKGRMKS